MPCGVNRTQLFGFGTGDRDQPSGAEETGDQDQPLEAEEEIQPQKSLRTPPMPTQEDMAEHRSNGHLPYRDWCSDCVEAFGREWAHPSSGGSGQRSIPLLSCDYLFITPKGVFLRKELPDEEIQEALKVLVMYCSATKALFAHAVPKKGVDQNGYIVNQVKQNAIWLGHPKVVLKGDNEPALVQVLEAAATALRSAGVSANDEGSVPYDPQTNGAAENAVKLLKGTLRANLLGLERQLQARIPVDHPALTWLVAHSAHVRTLRVRGPDGRTAQQRARGSDATTRLIPFGELCRYKSRSKEGTIAGLPAKWSTGVWLGLERRTGQYTIYDIELKAVRHARTILRLPEPQKWSIGDVQGIAVTPWSIHEPTGPEVTFPQKDTAPENLPAKQRMARRMYIRQEDLDKHGYTQGCPKCDHLLTHGPSTGAIAHSEACRARLMEAIAASPGGKERLQKMETRRNDYLDDHARKHDADEGTTAQGGIDGEPRDAPEVIPPSEFVPFTPSPSKSLSSSSAA